MSPLKNRHVIILANWAQKLIARHNLYFQPLPLSLRIQNYISTDWLTSLTSTFPKKERKNERKQKKYGHASWMVPQEMTISSSTLFLRLEPFPFLTHMKCLPESLASGSQPFLSVPISLCPISDSSTTFLHSAARDMLDRQEFSPLTRSKAKLT